MMNGLSTMVVAVAGMPGSGKGELSEVAAGLGIRVVSLGDVVRHYYSIDNPDGPGELIGAFAANERALHGKDIWARRLLNSFGPRVPSGSSLLLVDGLRSREEAEYLRSELGGNFMVLAIHSSPAVRFDRLIKRGRSDSPMTKADFDERDRRELSWGMGDVISTADIMLINDEDLEGFKVRVSKTLKGLEGRI